MPWKSLCCIEFWENHPEADDITAQQVLHRRRYLEASFDGDVEVSVSEDEQDEEGSVEAEEKEENGREKGEDEEPEKDNSCVAVSNPFALLADDDWDACIFNSLRSDGTKPLSEPMLTYCQLNH